MLRPSDTNASDSSNFDFTSSLSGTTGLVGASGSGTNGTTVSGEAYVYRNLNTTTGTVNENARLLPSDALTIGVAPRFGFAVSLSGATGLVGAYSATTNGNANQGAAYVYRNLDTASGTVTQNAKLFASDGAASDFFGFALGLSGNTALVGAYQNAVGGISRAGAAYLFRNLDTATGTVTQNVKLFATSGTASAYFGSAISLDGDSFIIGSYGYNSNAGRSYTGSLGSVSTLDLGNTSKIISGISFVSQDNWVVGQNTSGNQVTLGAGDSATVTASGKAVYVGQNAGSNNNRLVIAGTVNANSFVIGATGNTSSALQLGNGGTMGSLPVAATITDNGVLAFNRSNAVVQGTDFNASPLAGTGGVTQLGAGTTTLNAANTYTGATVVSAGTLQAGIASVTGTSGAFGNNSAVTLGNVSGATLALNGFNTQIGSLTGGGNTGGNVTLGTATLTVGGNNTSPAAYAGTISGTGGLTKIGTGTLTLAGANSYLGATLVNAGTLLVNGTNSGTGLVTVQNSGVTLGGTGTLAAVNVTTGALAPGSNAGGVGSAVNTGRLTTGALTLSSTATSVFDLASGTTYDQLFANGNIALAGTLTLNVPAQGTFATGQVLDLFHNNSGVLTGTFSNFANAGTYTYGDMGFLATYTPTDFTLTVLSSVPEPSTWVGGALLLAGTGWTLRRRRVILP